MVNFKSNAKNYRDAERFASNLLMPMSELKVMEEQQGHL